MHDEVGNLSFVNQTFCDYFGVDRNEMREGEWRQLTHPDDIESYGAEFTSCVRERRRFHREDRARRAEGEWRWQESCAHRHAKNEWLRSGKVDSPITLGILCR
jgi:PAS domain S-box-containing protein